MSYPLVLDADGLSELASPSPSGIVRNLVIEARNRDRPVLVPAVVCAEICRGASRTRSVEATLRRYRGRTSNRPVIEVVPTDIALAKQVGAVLYDARAGTEDVVDAHVVSICVPFGGGVVVTSDPDDISRLAAAVPSIRIVTRPPR